MRAQSEYRDGIYLTNGFGRPNSGSLGLRHIKSTSALGKFPKTNGGDASCVLIT
ncbi:hypothetical protein AWB83_06515 [Caballeronia ptereochthonis]|uniref:Uncharacterized protein n=1 Tax=Caballeronia ptereochthonis TaxID=1777144 RepID=A0A158E5H3_9BURK|nr:hypothetical protein AWB83_06515 [Caballeronia ptereochthonis]